MGDDVGSSSAEAFGLHLSSCLRKWGGRVHRNEILNITQFAFSCAFTENVLWGSASLFLISFLGCFSG